jgi:hypothetical protein
MDGWIERERERGRSGRGGEQNFLYFTASLRIMVFERNGVDIYT